MEKFRNKNFTSLPVRPGVIVASCDAITSTTKEPNIYIRESVFVDRSGIITYKSRKNSGKRSVNNDRR